LNQLIGKDCQDKFKPEDSQLRDYEDTTAVQRLEIMKWFTRSEARLHYGQ